MRIACLIVAAAVIGACGNAGSGASTATLPPECDHYFRVMAVCNANGETSSPEEAQATYDGYVADWREHPGELTAEQCRTTAAMVEETQRNGCG